jgi:hypothetical protein
LESLVVPALAGSTTLAKVIHSTRARVGYGLQHGDGQIGEVEVSQHVLGVGINLNALNLEGRDLGDVVVATLALLLLKLDGDATHRGLLNTAHQMCGETSNLIAELLGGNDGNFLNNALVGLEIAGQASVVLLDNELRSLLNGLGADTTLLTKEKFISLIISHVAK